MPRGPNATRWPMRTRLSRPGWVFLVLTVIMAVGAVRVQAPLMYLVVGAMLGSLLVSAAISRRMVRYLDLEREAPSRIHQHQTVHVGYYLRNPRRGSCLSLSLRERCGSEVRSATAYLACLGSRAVARSAGRFTASRRGLLTLGAVEVSCDFPFHLVRSSRRLDKPVEVLVWPAQGRLMRPLLHRGAVEVSTSAPSLVGGGSDDFFGLRDYRGGDNPRWIHWRRSAGRSVPVLREMSHPVPDLLYVLLDTQVDPAHPDQLQCLERMIRFTATLVDYAISRDYQVGLALAQDDGPRVIAAQPGRGQLHHLLDCLALVGVNASWGMEKVVSQLKPKQLRYAQVVLVGRHDDLGPAIWRPLRRDCRHMVVVTPRLLDVFYDDGPSTPAEASGGLVHAGGGA